MSSDLHDEPTESLQIEVPPPEVSWETQVYLRFKNKCGSCGSTERLVVRLLTPEAVGGQKVESNGIVLCRTCDLGTKMLPKPGASSFPHPMNFYVSNHLHYVIQQHAPRYGGTGGFLRQLIDVYLTSPEQYADLEQYQDSTVDVKLNFHLPSSQFEEFKSKTKLQGMTMTDALRGLILLYHATNLTGATDV